MSIGQKILVGALLVGLNTGCDLVEQAGLLCNTFTETTTVEKVLADHAQALQQIENIRPGHTNVRFIEVRGCTGKARLEILYATERDRQKIKQLIGDTFFDIPYQMQNV